MVAQDPVRPPRRFPAPWLAGAMLAWLAMLLLGGFAWDRGLLIHGYAGDTGIEGLALLVTRLGDWEMLLAIAFAAAAWLVARRRARDAGLLILFVLSGRLLVALQKIAFARVRPAENAHLVDVTTLSFPSGHAANSVMTFVLIALFLAGRDRRAPWLAAAILGGVAVGTSRVLLGVHWPSDVIGGWAFATFWVALCWWARGRWALDSGRNGSPRVQRSSVRTGATSIGE